MLATRFGHSRDMIVSIEIENGSCDPDHAPLEAVCQLYAWIWSILPVCKIWRFWLKLFEKYHGPKI